MTSEELTLQAVDDFEVPEMLMPRIAQEHDYSLGYAKGALREARRRLYLSVISGENISPSIKVDMAWHEMMLFTRHCQAFAKFIGAFIHHDPTPGPPDGGRLYQKTKKNYKKYLGIEPGPDYWP